MDELRLGGLVVRRQDALAHATSYLTRGHGWAYPWYDGFDAQHAAGPLVDADLLAPLLLNVNRISISTYAALQAVLPRLQAALDNISPALSLADANPDQVADVGELFAVLDDPGGPDARGTVLSKMLHRKRPALTRCTTSRSAASTRTALTRPCLPRQIRDRGRSSELCSRWRSRPTCSASCPSGNRSLHSPQDLPSPRCARWTLWPGGRADSSPIPATQPTAADPGHHRPNRGPAELTARALSGWTRSWPAALTGATCSPCGSAQMRCSSAACCRLRPPPGSTARASRRGSLSDFLPIDLRALRHSPALTPKPCPFGGSSHDAQGPSAPAVGHWLGRRAARDWPARR